MNVPLELTVNRAPEVKVTSLPTSAVSPFTSVTVIALPSTGSLSIPLSLSANKFSPVRVESSLVVKLSS